MNPADILLYVRPLRGGEDSHALLRCAAARYTGAAGDFTLARGTWGKPCFPLLPDVCFSISHSGDFWMCAFSPRPVGLDVQFHVPRNQEKLSRRFFHPEEDAFLRRGGYDRFYDVWAAKESYLKYTGRGITDDLSAFSVVSGGCFPAVAGAALQLISWREDYSLCLCAGEMGAVVLTAL
jgi:4'-phosphopantetheinyl transferase